MHYHYKTKIDPRYAWGSRAFMFVKTTRNLSVMAVTLLLAACSHIVILPAEEYKPFEAKQQSLRIIEAPKIYFLFIEDTATVCEALVGRLQANERYLGCAHWRMAEQACTVFIPSDTKSVILGHEVRHCFEGKFH